MDYEDYEVPEVDATIYYQNKDYFSCEEFCEKFVTILEKYKHLDITNIELGKECLLNGILKNYVVRYNKKEVDKMNLQAEIYKWVNDNEIAYISLIHKEKRKWDWDITWFKDYKSFDGISISDYMFNHISIGSSYKRFDNSIIQSYFINLFCDFSDLFEAFYGRIEDVSTAIDVMDRTKEKCFNEKYIQTIYWGNFIGNKFFSNIDPKKLNSIPCENTKKLKNGIFFCLTNNIFDSKNNPDYRKRNRVYRYLFKNSIMEQFFN